MRWGDRGLNKFKINTEYAAYSSIEGLALKNAFSQKDHAKALEYLKDYIVAREIKQTYMPLEAVLDEQFLSVLEGTPSYSSLKMAMLIRDMAYKPQIHRQDDPFFFKFKFIDGYLENILEKGLLFAVGLTIDKRGKYYLYGAYQCFILDRFVPGWKQNFFRKKKNLDQLIANFLKLSPAQKKEIVNRLKTKYSFDDLYAKHDAIIKKRVQKEK